MDAECQKCGDGYAVRENCEPTPFCDECAHGEVERLSELVERLGNALREQNNRWGLYGKESQQALEAFEELKASAALPLANGSETSWRDMKTAPMDATWVEVMMKNGGVVRAHWAEGGGEEQPPFRGWFVDAGSFFREIDRPVAWKPISSNEKETKP